MSQYAVFAYCTAMGFVVAGTIASFYQLVTSERADFFAARPSFASWVVAIMLIMFSGPAILARKILTGLRSREISLPIAAGLLVFTGMWSSCAGLFFVALLVSA